MQPARGVINTFVTGVVITSPTCPGRAQSTPSLEAVAARQSEIPGQNMQHAMSATARNEVLKDETLPYARRRSAPLSPKQ
jgi:hypothetical protein